MPPGVYVHKKRPLICGVYAVLNTETGDTYIGSSQDINERITNHRSYIRHKTHWNTNIRKALKQYNPEDFSYLILEECIVEDQYKTEQWWLDYWHPEYNNIEEASACNIGVTVPLITRERVSQSLIGNNYALGKHGGAGKPKSKEHKEALSRSRKEYFARRKVLEGTEA